MDMPILILIPMPTLLPIGTMLNLPVVLFMLFPMVFTSARLSLTLMLMLLLTHGTDITDTVVIMDIPTTGATMVIDIPTHTAGESKPRRNNLKDLENCPSFRNCHHSK